MFGQNKNRRDIQEKEYLFERTELKASISDIQHNVQTQYVCAR